MKNARAWDEARAFFYKQLADFKRKIYLCAMTIRSCAAEYHDNPQQNCETSELLNI